MISGRYVAIISLTIAGTAHADEGMWTFDNFPAATVKQQLGVTIDQRWLDRVRIATVRLSGCTGSFVSKDGAILTNHHCVASCLDQLSTAENDLFARGFVTRERNAERRCPTQIADVLMAMENITDKLNAATRGLGEQAANDVRKKTLTQLEQSCEQASKNDPRKCESVSLYNGGQYFLYKYKRYTDVRLVFAPEATIAAFGGDPDNFQYPRWCLDISVLRAYENGRPATTPNHLRIDFRGPAAGDPVFVVGHPGSTDRQLTVSQLLAQRNLDLPEGLLRSSELRGRMIQFAKQSPEAQRIVGDSLQGLENGIKVRRKQLDALLDDRLVERKRQEEAKLRQSVAANSQLRERVGTAWEEIERALQVEAGIYFPYTQLEAGAAFNSRLFRYARTLVRGAAERDKPNDQRLREYVDARLPRVEQSLAAIVPVYADFEVMTLSYSLERMRELLGPDHPTVRRLLAKDSPDSLAKQLVTNSKLNDAQVRLALWKGGSAAVAASSDPMIALARSLDPEARGIRKTYEDQVEAPIRVAEEKIANARFAVLGTSVYPDATFTLRINYGSVQGWREHGKDIQPFTRLTTAFERETGAEPFRIPDSWQAVRSQLDMNTTFNVSTNSDIVGGNSGSALISAQGNVVGLMFDGNIHSISGAYWFDTEKNRAIAVHPAIMREGLSKVYKAEALLKELEGK
jgi:hypothetical protein